MRKNWKYLRIILGIAAISFVVACEDDNENLFDEIKNEAMDERAGMEGDHSTRMGHGMWMNGHGMWMMDCPMEPPHFDGPIIDTAFIDSILNFLGRGFGNRTVDCPNLHCDIGDPCITAEKRIGRVNDDCECKGAGSFDCPRYMKNIGEACMTMMGQMGTLDQNCNCDTSSPPAR